MIPPASGAPVPLISTERGPFGGWGTVARNVEADGIIHWSEDIVTDIGAGMFKIPFGYEVLQSDADFEDGGGIRDGGGVTWFGLINVGVAIWPHQRDQFHLVARNVANQVTQNAEGGDHL